MRLCQPLPTFTLPHRPHHQPHPQPPPRIMDKQLDTIVCMINLGVSRMTTMIVWSQLPYLGMVGRFRSNDPRFGDFQSNWVPILYLSTIRLIPSFCRKQIGLSLSHLFPEILRPKFG